MIVLSVSCCPPKLRGDLSKWLMEISTGVYVGQTSARVRDALWKRVCDNISSGQATMVYSTNNEQHMDFRIYNTGWLPVDYDGIKLIRRPLSGGSLSAKEGYSSAVQRQLASRRQFKKLNVPKDYAVIDVETTGLNPASDRIIEIGILSVRDGVPEDASAWLLNTDTDIPAFITELTGIDNTRLRSDGIPLSEGINRLIKEIDGRDMIFYHASFDCAFLDNAYETLGLEPPEGLIIDAMVLSRKRIRGLKDYKLETVAKHLGIDTAQSHRAAGDCRLLYEVYTKLNEL